MKESTATMIVIILLIVAVLTTIGATIWHEKENEFLCKLYGIHAGYSAVEVQAICGK